MEMMTPGVFAFSAGLLLMIAAIAVLLVFIRKERTYESKTTVSEDQEQIDWKLDENWFKTRSDLQDQKLDSQ